MAEEDESNQIRPMVTDPYYFRPLYSILRKLIQTIGSWPTEIIAGHHFLEHTRDHDTIRRLESWNFIGRATESEIAEYEAGISVLDFDVPYKITAQARELAALELNNVSDLDRAVLILLRADYSPEQRIGLYIESVLPSIGFYELVMLLGKTESAIQNSLARLNSRGFVDAKLLFDDKGRVWKFGTEIAITDSGLFFLNNGGSAMTYNNINISNSTIGVFALQSTLSNIDAQVGGIKQAGHDSLAKALSSITGAVADSSLTESEKRDILDQIEVISEAATKQPGERKSAPINGALAFLEKALSSAASLAAIWTSFGPAITAFFGR